LWRVAKLVLLSVLLHLPLTPIFGLLGLFSWTAMSEPEPPSLGPIKAIPIEMFEADPGGAEQSAQARGSEALEPDTVAIPDKPQQPTPKPEQPRELADAGAPDAGSDDSRDAGADALAASDAGAGDAGVGPGKDIGDPVALSGSAGRVADANANVRLIIYNQNIRSHALGARMGKMLRSIGQWRDFFGPTGLDPIRDIDRMLIAGPQLRDSSEVMVVLKYNVSEQRVRQAIDVLVKRDPNGAWIDGKVPAARARADRADRIFVMPRPGLLVVTPPSALANVLKVASKIEFAPPKGREALTAYVVTPWRVFMGLPFQFPRSLKWARLQVTPTSGGGVEATFRALDESEEMAKRNAHYLHNTVGTATKLNLGVLGALLGKSQHSFLEKVEFRAEKDEISGIITATPGQVASGFDMIEAKIADFEQRMRERQRKQSPVSGTPAAPKRPNLPQPIEMPAPGVQPQ
jgi:hypothetical protein